MNNDSQSKDTHPNSTHHTAVVIAIGRLLKGIPLIGEFLETIWLAWRWPGALLLVCGFALAVFCAHFVPLPPSIFGKYCPTILDGKDRAILSRNDQTHLRDKANGARQEIRGSGLALSVLNPEKIIEKAVHEEGFSANIVMMYPCGKVVEQREQDEGGGVRVAGAKVLEQLTKYRDHAWSVNEEQRKQVNNSLTISLLEAYPTMNVLIVDENLYAYFCIYRHRCDESPVLTFEDYKKNESAQYFASQLTAIQKHAEKPTLQRFLLFGNAPMLKNPKVQIDCQSLGEYLEK